MFSNLKNRRSRQYPTEIMRDADDADELALLPNAPTQIESLLHNLEQPARGIDLYTNKIKQ